MRFFVLLLSLVAAVFSYPTSANTWQFQNALNGELLGSPNQEFVPRGVRRSDPFNIEDFRWRVRTMG